MDRDSLCMLDRMVFHRGTEVYAASMVPSKGPGMTGYRRGESEEFRWN